MAIFFNRNIFVSDAQSENPNLPRIGWHSIYNAASFGGNSAYLRAGSKFSAMWSADTYSACYFQNESSPVPAYAEIVLNGVADFVDYIGIAGHNFYKKGIVCTIVGVTTTDTFVEIVPPFSTTSERAIVKFFNPVYGLKQIKIILTLPAYSKDVRIAHIRAGISTKLQRPVWGGETPAGMDVKVNKIASKSYSGQHLGSVVLSRGMSFAINQRLNTASFVRSRPIQEFFKHAYECEKLSEAPVETFFYSWRPESHPSEAVYCGAITSFNAPTNDSGSTSGGYMSWGMTGDAF